MASRDWLNKIKSGAKSVQETAKNKLDKISETVDKKLKEAQEDLEKQRAKADSSGPVGAHLQRWRPSAENPDGELVAEAKPTVTPPPPPPSTPTTPVVQPTIATTPETPQAPPQAEEPITIVHRGKRRAAKKNISSSISADQETDLNNHKNDQTFLNKTSNESIEKTPAVNETVDITTTNMTTQEEESTPIQTSYSHVENNVNKEKEEPAPIKTELQQENIQTVIPTDNVTPIMNVAKTTSDQSGSNDLSQTVTQEELPTTKDIDQASIENSLREDSPIYKPNDEVELPTSTKTDDFPPVPPDTENISMKTSEKEVPTLTNDETALTESTDAEKTPIDELKNELLATTDVYPQSEESPAHKQHDQTPTTKDVDDSSVVDYQQEDILISKMNNENELSTVDTNLNNVSKEIPDEQSSTLTNNDDATGKDAELENFAVTNTTVDESSTLPVTDELPVVEPTPDNMQLKILDAQQFESLNVDETPVVTSDLEDTQINRSVHEESPEVTHIEEVPIEHFESEIISIDTPLNEEPTTANTMDASSTNPIPDIVSIDAPVDQLATLTNIDNVPDTHSTPENIQIKTPDVEPSPLTNIEGLSSSYSNVENETNYPPNDELLETANIDNASDTYNESQNILTQVPDEELPTVTNIDELSTDNIKSDDMSIKKSEDEDELQTLTNNDNLTTINSGSDNIPTKMPDDEPTTSTNIEHSTMKHSDVENIPTSIVDAESPTRTNMDDTSNSHINIETIPVPGSYNVSWPTTDTENSPTPSVGSENYSFPATGDEYELSTLPKADDIPIISSKLDDELSTSTNMDDSINKYLDSENLPTKTAVDEVSTLSDTDELTAINSNLNNESSTNNDDSITEQINIEDIPTQTKVNEIPVLPDIDELPKVNSNLDNKLPTSTNLDDSITKYTDLENNSTKTTVDEEPTSPDTDDFSIVDSTLKNSQIEITNDQPSTLLTTNQQPIVQTKIENNSKTIFDDDSPILSDIDDTSFEQPKPKVELPTVSNIVPSPVKRRDSKTSRSIVYGNQLNIPSSEFEDAFDEIKVQTTSVQKPPEQPSQNTTHLAALRAFISKMEDDTDENEDFRVPKQDTIISEKTVTIIPEQQVINTSDVKERTLSALSTSLSDEFREPTMTDSLAQSNSLADDQSYDERTESIWPTFFETKSIENKGVPLVNSHPIPTGTKISYINCSSTYIYLCTNERKVFYAKLNPNEIEYPFKWEQHADLAEKIVVSVTNRTVWRLLNKHVYTSNDPVKFPPLGSKWNEFKINQGQSLLSISINDQCGWFIKQDGTLWLIRNNDKKSKPLNVNCPFNLNTVFCFSEKVGVSTSDGDILIRVGCTNDCPEGDGWIFIDHNFGPIDDFQLLTMNNIILIIDKKHRLWMHECSSDKGFYEILSNDESIMSHERCLLSVNSELLCMTDCVEQIRIFSDSLTGYQWKVVEEHTRLQRLIGAFSNEDFVWALTTDRLIATSNGRVLDKPRQAQCLTHASFVPNNSSPNTVLWSLDESCSIYVRSNLENDSEWEQVNQIQFEWSRRLVNIACNYAGVWAVDDQGYIHFRHRHISASQTAKADGQAALPPAWITVPGEAKKYRSFAQVFCGPTYWMVYATDNKQNVYAREGINKENRVGASWKLMEDCSALELAISSDTLWVLTSHGQIECRENISITNPIGTRSTTLPGLFLSLTVSIDDSQVWALDSKRNLLKLDRLTVLFEK